MRLLTVSALALILLPSNFPVPGTKTCPPETNMQYMLFLPVTLFGLDLEDCDSDPPCIPEGDTSEIEHARPPLGQAGDPVGAEWTGGGSGCPQAFDDEFYSKSAPLGAGTPGTPEDTATVPIENKGGNLSGPNGNTENGGLDGDCIEVYMRWSYRYKVTKSISKRSSVKIGSDGGSGGSGTTKTRTVTYWAIGYKRSCVQEVCPCS